MTPFEIGARLVVLQCTCRLQLSGHDLRKLDQALTRIFLSSSQGRQLKTWLDAVFGDINQPGSHMMYGARRWKLNSVDIYKELAANVNAWVAVIRDIHIASLSSSRSLLQL